jgi:hypothetical protein
VRNGELDCIHGIGHSANNHGCDGCCFALGVYERERIIKLLEDENCPILISCTDKVIALIKGENK